MNALRSPSLILLKSSTVDAIDGVGGIWNCLAFTTNVTVAAPLSKRGSRFSPIGLTIRGASEGGVKDRALHLELSDLDRSLGDCRPQFSAEKTVLFRGRNTGDARPSQM